MKAIKKNKEVFYLHLYDSSIFIGEMLDFLRTAKGVDIPFKDDNMDAEGEIRLAGGICFRFLEQTINVPFEHTLVFSDEVYRVYPIDKFFNEYIPMDKEGTSPGTIAPISVKSHESRNERFFVEVENKNLTFSEALLHLKEGKGIKVPEWKGYWFLEGGEITVMTESGVKQKTPWYHQNVLREDWQSGNITMPKIDLSQYLKFN